MCGGCEHFKWIDDSFCDKVRSMIVALLLKNEWLVVEIEALQKLKREREDGKQELKRLKDQNDKLQVKVHGYQMMERILMWSLLPCLLVIAIAIGAGGEGDENVGQVTIILDHSLEQVLGRVVSQKQL